MLDTFMSVASTANQSSGSFAWDKVVDISDARSIPRSTGFVDPDRPVGDETFDAMNSSGAVGNSFCTGQVPCSCA